MGLFRSSKKSKHDVDDVWERLDAVVQGLDNQSQLLHGKFEQLIQGIDNLAKLLNAHLVHLSEAATIQVTLMERKQRAQDGKMN
jgi:hypothetical protein